MEDNEYNPEEGFEGGADEVILIFFLENSFFFERT